MAPVTMIIGANILIALQEALTFFVFSVLFAPVTYLFWVLEAAWLFSFKCFEPLFVVLSDFVFLALKTAFRLISLPKQTFLTFKFLSTSGLNGLTFVFQAFKGLFVVAKKAKEGVKAAKTVTEGVVKSATFFTNPSLWLSVNWMQSQSRNVFVTFRSFINIAIYLISW